MNARYFKINFSLILLFLMALVVFNIGCQKEIPCDQKTTTFEISSSDKGRIPYAGFDTLTFVRTSDSATHTFISKGWNNGYDAYYTAEDCPQKELRASRFLFLQSSSFPETITLNHNVIENSIFFSKLSISFQKTKFMFKHVDIIGSNNHATLTIQNKIYTEIDSFSNDYYSNHALKYICYYNIQYGILRMKLENGEVWDLLEKK